MNENEVLKHLLNIDLVSLNQQVLDLIFIKASSYFFFIFLIIFGLWAYQRRNEEKLFKNNKQKVYILLFLFAPLFARGFFEYNLYQKKIDVASQNLKQAIEIFELHKPNIVQYYKDREELLNEVRKGLAEKHKKQLEECEKMAKEENKWFSLKIINNSYVFEKHKDKYWIYSCFVSEAEKDI